MIAPEFVFEPISWVAPLGLRFWDVTAQQPVTEGLLVSAAPKLNPHARVAAQAGPSGSYSFAHLPGLRGLEFGAGDEAYWQAITPADRRDFTIQIVDGNGRYHPCIVNAAVPRPGLLGLADMGCGALQVAPNMPGGYVPLFAKPGRVVPLSMAVIRGECRNASASARWAVVEALHKGAVLNQAVADEHGRFVLGFPYPMPETRAALDKQSWRIEIAVGDPPDPKAITLRAYYTAALSGQEVVNLCDLLRQPVGALTTQPNASADLKLLYAKPFVFKTVTVS